MISMLKSWNGAVEINNESFESIDAFISKNKTLSGPISIKLYPKQSNPVVESNNTVKTDIMTTSESQIYKITVKQYMTKPASPEFDFMAKWNNNNPMPLRTMTGIKLKETRGMVQMQLRGMAEKTCTCMRCGRTLTNPVSKLYGIGPECMSKLGMIRMDIEDVEGITQKLEEVEWTGWIIKSAITSQEEI